MQHRHLQLQGKQVPQLLETGVPEERHSQRACTTACPTPGRNTGGTAASYIPGAVWVQPLLGLHSCQGEELAGDRNMHVKPVLTELVIYLVSLEIND